MLSALGEGCSAAPACLALLCPACSTVPTLLSPPLLPLLPALQSSVTPATPFHAPDSDDSCSLDIAILSGRVSLGSSGRRQCVQLAQRWQVGKAAGRPRQPQPHVVQQPGLHLWVPPPATFGQLPGSLSIRMRCSSRRRAVWSAVGGMRRPPAWRWLASSPRAPALSLPL